MRTGRPILLVTRGLDPVGSGCEVELIAASLHTQGLPVEVAVTSAGGSVPERLAARGLTVHRLGHRPLVDAGSVARLARLAGRIRPAAILGFGRGQSWPVVVARSAAAGSRAGVRLGLAPRGRRQAWLLGRLDCVIPTSSAVAAACGRLGVATARIAVVLPGVARLAGGGLSRVDLAARLGLDPACRWTLAVAPLEPGSHLQGLLWAIDQLGVVRKDLQHVLVGSGPLLHAIWRRARAQELDERLFIIPSSDLLPDLVDQAALVWQSGEVALGGCLLDGMARGLPAVAVECAAARQVIVDGETGRIVPAVPESEFPRRAFGILEDDSLAGRYAAAAAVRAAEMFGAERMVAGVLTALALPR
jgi:glycosyltransferase involved in cell wall biosynthesis